MRAGFRVQGSEVSEGPSGMFSDATQRRPVSDPDMAAKKWMVENRLEGWVAFNEESEQQTLPMETESLAIEGAFNLQYALDQGIIRPFAPGSKSERNRESVEATPRVDKAFRQALHSTEGAAARWDLRRERGLTDAEMYKAISDEIGQYTATAQDGAPFHTKSGKTPKFYFGVSSTNGATPTLQGKALIDKAREILKIDAPAELTASWGQPKADMTSVESRKEYWDRVNSSLRHALKIDDVDPEQLAGFAQFNEPDLLELISSQLSDDTYADQDISYTTAGGKVPQLWIGNNIDRSNPTLQGKPLVMAVRNLLRKIVEERQEETTVETQTETVVQTPAPLRGERFEQVAIRNIWECKTNPREDFNEESLNELAESIKEKGVIEPVILRPYAEGDNGEEIFELVAGARRFRASKIAEQEFIPAIIRDYDDRTAAEVQILENLQRKDLTPIEQANGFKRLIDDLGYSKDQVAQKAHKSKSYVYGSLKLIGLPKVVADALSSGEISASVGTRIGRIPNQQTREEAGKYIVGNTHLRTDKNVAEYIARSYMVELKGAPFDIKNAKLYLEAGSCVDCPKRTGNNPVEFPDSRADICTDPGCFKVKTEAAIDAHLEKERKRGFTVLTRDQGKQICPYSFVQDRRYVDLGDTAYSVGDGDKTFGELLEGDVKKIVIADGFGKFHYLAEAEEVQKVLEQKKLVKKEKQSTTRGESAVADVKWQKENRTIEVTRAKIGEAIATAATKVSPGTEHIRALAVSLVYCLADYDDGELLEIVLRRGWVLSKDEAEDPRIGDIEALLGERLLAASGKEAFSFIMEYCYQIGMGYGSGRIFDAANGIATIYELDRKEIEKLAKQDVEAEFKAKAAEAKLAAKAETKAKAKK